MDHDVVDSDQANGINGKRLAKLCAEDWGICKTFTIVLDKTAAMIEKFDLTPREKEIAKERIERIRRLIDNEPKSMNWKMRAKLGEKLRRYMLPDDMAD